MRYRMTPFELKNWMAERKALEPLEVRRILSHQLAREETILFTFGPEDACISEEDALTMDRWEIDEMVKDIATDFRNQRRSKYPENDFRYYSRLEREGNGRYYFTVEMTEVGERAHRCAKLKQCCNAETGELDKEATIAWWLNRSFFQALDQSERFPWQDEIWATEIARKIMWRDRGFDIKQGTSSPDPRSTRATFRKRLLQAVEAGGPKALKHARQTWFKMDEPWARCFQEELMEVVLSV